MIYTMGKFYCLVFYQYLTIYSDIFSRRPSRRDLLSADVDVRTQTHFSSVPRHSPQSNFANFLFQ